MIAPVPNDAGSDTRTVPFTIVVDPVRVLASGASLSEVAHELYLSPNTVKTHRRTIYRKLGVSSRGELLRWAAGDGGERPAP